MKDINKKNILYLFATLIQILLFIGAFVLNYFTRRRMGMARYVLYKNRNWENTYPVEEIQTAFTAGLIILSILLILFFYKNKKRLSRKALYKTAGVFILSGLWIGFKMLNTTQSIRAYYFILLVLGAAAVIQILKAAVRIMIELRDQKR